MTLRMKSFAAALVAATVLGAAGGATPAMAENGRIGAFLGGAIVGSMLNNGYAYGYQPYYAPPPPPPPRVVVREYYPVPYYGGERWHHRHWDHDRGWHRGWDRGWDR